MLRLLGREKTLGVLWDCHGPVTVSLMSANTSNVEALGAREDVGRPLGLPLRPLGKQPGFALRFDRDFLLTTRAFQAVVRRPSAPTSVRSRHRHRPDRYRVHGKSARS